jgi:hypothetical protein
MTTPADVAALIGSRLPGLKMAIGGVEGRAPLQGPGYERALAGSAMGA